MQIRKWIREHKLLLKMAGVGTIIIVMYALASTMFVEKFERETKYQYTGNLFMMPFRYGVLDQAEQEFTKCMIDCLGYDDAHTKDNCMRWCCEKMDGLEYYNGGLR